MKKSFHQPYETYLTGFVGFKQKTMPGQLEEQEMNRKKSNWLNLERGFQLRLHLWIIAFLTTSNSKGETFTCSSPCTTKCLRTAWFQQHKTTRDVSHLQGLWDWTSDLFKCSIEMGRSASALVLNNVMPELWGDSYGSKTQVNSSAALIQPMLKPPPLGSHRHRGKQVVMAPRWIRLS